MPYRRQGSCVQIQKGERWHNLKCYDSTAKAERYRRALEANVDHKTDELDVDVEDLKAVQLEDEEKSLYSNPRLEQDDPSVNYMAYASSLNQACGACRWYRGEGYCHLVESDPQSITAIGSCARFEADRESLLDNILDDIGEDEIIATPLTEPQKTNMRNLLRQVLGLNKSNNQLSAFKVLEDGKHWIGRWSNNFEDRQKQLFAEAAIDDYIGRVRAGEIPYPELWYFHLPGTKHGQAEKLWRSDHFACAFGSFDDTDIAKSLVSHYSKTSDKARGMSHGFFYPPSALRDGVFKKFTTFELTVLPPKYAANPYTTFKTYQEVADMKAASLPADAQAELKEALGEDLFKEFVSDNEQQGKALEDAGMRFKNDDDDTPSPLEKRIDTLTEVVEKLAGEVVTMKAAYSGSGKTEDDEDEDMNKSSEDTSEEKTDEVSVTELAQEIRALTGAFKSFFGLQPRGSQNQNTLLDERNNPADQKTAEYLQRKQREAQQGKSVVQQVTEGSFNSGWGNLGPGSQE